MWKHDKVLSFLVILVLILTTFLPAAGFAEEGSTISHVNVESLKTEYAENPLGIDVTRPRLSWVLESDKRAQKQTAYQVLVSTTEEKLAADNGDMWDSGKVMSDQSTNIEYNGLALDSGKRYYWKVRVWDKDGNISAWSAPVFWGMGLLNPSDWNAKWISPSFKDEIVWTDYTLEMDFTVKQAAAGILFRAKDKNNFYLWQINTVIGPTIKLRPHICKNGSYSILKEVPLGNIIPKEKENTQHHIKIEVYGNEFKTYIDGNLVDDTVDNTFSTGTFGFRAGDAAEYGLFDNVKVYDRDAKLLFQDDFSNPGELNFPGTAIVDGKMEIRQYVVALYTLLDVGEWTDYTIEADVTVEQNGAGIVFRAKDSNNFYMWQINTKLGPTIKLRPHICVNGSWRMLTEVPLGNIISKEEENTEHHIRIELNGNEIKTYIDGVLADTRTDSTFKSGTIGLRTGDNTEYALYDNIKVYDRYSRILFEDDFSDPNVKNFAYGTVVNGKLELTGGRVVLRQDPLPQDSPIMRKDFNLEKEVKNATAYVYGLGWYELHLNGAKVGDRVLTPANTRYNRLNLYDTYDVTEFLKSGGNAAGIWLGNGYNENYSQYGWKFEDAKRAILQINVEFTDGTSTSIVTDDTWKVSNSPIIYNHIYNGETNDARLEKTGWDTFGYDSSDWKPVKIVEAPGSELVSDLMPPIKVAERIKPVSVSQPQPGVYVFDMGQNFAGWARLYVQGAAGTQVTMKYSELIGDNGMIDPWTNRNAKATERYILKGKGVEVYEPRFTYHGFRYVEVTGFPGTPTLDSLEGCVVHSDVESASCINTSNPLLNQIQSNIRWGILSNLMSIPTDCSQRDERTPCQMDSQVVEEAAINNFNMDQYYTKWLRDIKGDNGNPDWSGDQMTLPWYLYQYYGDKKVLEDNYDNMKRYIEYINSKTPGHIYTEGFGDWCAPNIGTWDSYFNDVTIVNTTLFYNQTLTLSMAANILGKEDDAAKYAALANEIKNAFNDQLLDKSANIYGDGSQTTAILPLAFGMVPEDRKQAVSDNLVKNIMEVKDGHLDTGIFGTKYLVDVLADNGQVDTAYTVLNQATYPSFGYMISQDATTLWEQWYSKGGMNSHNHAMFSGVGASFYTRLGGITPLSSGYGKISIKPYIPEGLNYVNASIDTVKGMVSSNWRKEEDVFRLNVTVPVNTTAVVYVPAKGEYYVTESGKIATQADGVEFLHMEDGYAVFSVGSGNYEFASYYNPIGVLSGIQLSTDKEMFKTGETAQLALSGIMDDGSGADLRYAVISYTSSNDEVAVVNGRGVVTAAGEGLADITAAVTLDGVTVTDSIHVIVDQTPPIVNLTVNSQPFADGATFEDAQLLTFELTAEDAISGLDELVVLVDDQPYSSGTESDFAGKLGLHTLKAVATDKAGNRAEVIVRFKIVSSISSMHKLIERYIASGDLNGPLSAQLNNNLDQAQHQLDINRPDQAAKHMEDFIKHLGNEPMEEYVSDTAKRVLNIDSQALIDMWSVEALIYMKK